MSSEFCVSRLCSNIMLTSMGMRMVSESHAKVTKGSGPDTPLEPAYVRFSSALTSSLFAGSRSSFCV